jgi:hypothetical protein
MVKRGEVTADAEPSREQEQHLERPDTHIIGSRMVIRAVSVGVPVCARVAVLQMMAMAAAVIHAVTVMRAVSRRVTVIEQ